MKSKLDEIKLKQYEAYENGFETNKKIQTDALLDLLVEYSNMEDFEKKTNFETIKEIKNMLRQNVDYL